MASTTASTWGPKGFTGDVCAHGYVVGSCDGGLLRAGVHQVANESFGVFDVEATCLVEVPLVSGGPRSWPRFMSASPVVVAVRCGAVPRCSVMASSVWVGDIG
jgi:hypothetical protein